ncbi:MAG: antibiotic biosynthesis monooxygenase, partial [Pseudomonadota bacterium]
MFVAMNRFKVALGKESAFEQVWRGRDSHLHEMEGFVDFHLLSGPKRGDYTLYSSHTIWKTRSDFE